MKTCQEEGRNFPLFAVFSVFGRKTSRGSSRDPPVSVAAVSILSSCNIRPSPPSQSLFLLPPPPPFNYACKTDRSASAIDGRSPHLQHYYGATAFHFTDPREKQSSPTPCTVQVQASKLSISIIERRLFSKSPLIGFPLL